MICGSGARDGRRRLTRDSCGRGRYTPPLPAAADGELARRQWRPALFLPPRRRAATDRYMDLDSGMSRRGKNRREESKRGNAPMGGSKRLYVKESHLDACTRGNRYVKVGQNSTPQRGEHPDFFFFHHLSPLLHLRKEYYLLKFRLLN